MSFVRNEVMNYIPLGNFLDMRPTPCNMSNNSPRVGFEIVRAEVLSLFRASCFCPSNLCLYIRHNLPTAVSSML